MKSFTNQLAPCVLLAILLASPAFAQYSGGSAPSYGSGKAVAAGVGAAAAGAGVLYVVKYRKISLTGCIQGSDGDAPLSLVDEKKHQTYLLVPNSNDLKSGERVELRGKTPKRENGAQTFQVSKVVKRLGSCSMSAARS